jgi:tight adherence protein B
MMVARTANYDLALMVCAVQTQLETGGNMAEVLGKIASMIRERVRLQGEISVGSAEGRFAAVILIALPIALLLLLRIMSPNYLEPLFTTTIGQLILGAAGLLMIVGAIILKRLTTIRI